MISIVICSVNQKLLTQLKINIEETIGVPYQIVAVNNTGSSNGICAVYNRGGQKAAFPIICFIHEDIVFNTDNWGQLIINHFHDNPKIGLIGLAGGDTKGIVPTSWFTSFKSRSNNVFQLYKNDIQGARHQHFFQPVAHPGRDNVVTIDGVFMCTRREIFHEMKFDEILLKGFHGYDIDYSLQVRTKYQVVVIYDILIHHFSEGNLNREWLDSIKKVTKKWRKHLPVSTLPLSPGEYTFFHWKSLQVFIEHLFRLDFSYAEIIGYYLKYSFSRFFNLRRCGSLGKYIIQSFYKKFRRQGAHDLAAAYPMDTSGIVTKMNGISKHN